MVAIKLSLSTPRVPIPIPIPTYSPSPRPSQLFFRTRLLARAASSNDASTGSNQYVGGIPVAEAPSFETISYGEKFVSEVVVDEQPPPQSDFLLQNIKDFDSGDIVPVMLYGSGALVTLWLASAVVGAIDSIPLFPKLMELVGLAYTLWFSSRYLLYKKDREELAAKIEILKLEVLGFDDS